MGEKKREFIKEQENFKVERGVFDERTLLNIYKLMNKGYIDSVESIVKEGKESVVLAGLDKDGNWLAIKVYRTAACDYKNMWKYLVGDPRVRGLKKDRWSVVSTWCKKEFKNLKRAKAFGVTCPDAIAFRENVLVMSFIGEDGIPAPRLVDVELDDPKDVYDMVIDEMIKLSKAGLVHADLSAYNMLWYEKVWIIDFSHSLPLKHHILAEEFLRRDVKNVNKYFNKLGVETLGDEELYEKLIKAWKGG